ncbi:aspartic peptidase [Tanacetum coccineum]|uniref:Aspartic peptidase n=1 Tax=Tanacetum coccineum TaxID=301880 RepID=A0ABQ5IZV5_9ASTR
MLLFIKLFIVMVLAFISHEQQAVVAVWVPAYSSAVAPITKHTDADKDLYSLEITAGDVQLHFLIDIDAPLAWHQCIAKWPLSPAKCPKHAYCTTYVPCNELGCSDIRASYSYESPSCMPVNNNTILTGAECTCPVNVANPVTGKCLQVALSYDEFYIKTSNGRNMLSEIYGGYPNSGCAPSSAMKSFPKNVTGVLPFSRSKYAYPFQLVDPVKNILALCLPSTTVAPGVLLFGDTPYYLLPHSDVDVRSLLSYTPLLEHPSSFGYFIGINSIVIKERSIDLPMNTTARISTIDPYTTLRTDTYSHVVQRFIKVTKRIPRAEPVPPFSLCFKSVSNGTHSDLRVPDIDLHLQGGKKWTISTANCIKQITKGVACLALVDGGAKNEPAIVIGTFQLEDNFIVLDLVNSTFGFSSSLLHKQTSCSNFNFTLTN